LKKEARGSYNSLEEEEEPSRQVNFGRVSFRAVMSELMTCLSRSRTNSHTAVQPSINAGVVCTAIKYVDIDNKIGSKTEILHFTASLPKEY
jgi:hypothetical protein